MDSVYILAIETTDGVRFYAFREREGRDFVLEFRKHILAYLWLGHANGLPDTRVRRR